MNEWYFIDPSLSIGWYRYPKLGVEEYRDIQYWLKSQYDETEVGSLDGSQRKHIDLNDKENVVWPVLHSPLLGKTGTWFLCVCVCVLLTSPFVVFSKLCSPSHRAWEQSRTSGWVTPAATSTATVRHDQPLITLGRAGLQWSKMIRYLRAGKRHSRSGSREKPSHLAVCARPVLFLLLLICSNPQRLPANRPGIGAASLRRNQRDVKSMFIVLGAKEVL